MAKGLLADVTIEELMQLRADGNSNSESAEQCGVSTARIYQLIGKQPKEITAKRIQDGKAFAETDRLHDKVEKMRKAVERKIEMDKPTFDDAPCSPVVENRLPDAPLLVSSIAMEGSNGFRYIIDDKAVQIQQDSYYVLLPKDKLPGVIAELKNIMRHICTDMKDQMWV